MTMARRSMRNACNRPNSLGRSSKDAWFDNVSRSPLELHEAAYLHLAVHHSNQLSNRWKICYHAPAHPLS